MGTPTEPVVVREVGLRDGLQILPRVLPTAHTLEWLRAAHDAGPQLADTAERVAFARTLPGLTAAPSGAPACRRR